jgi:hypothetical protein
MLSSVDVRCSVIEHLREIAFMRDRGRLSLLIAVLAPAAGMAMAKANVVGANPQTFFGLGVLAAISVGGIVLGLIEGARKVR